MVIERRVANISHHQQSGSEGETSVEAQGRRRLALTVVVVVLLLVLILVGFGGGEEVDHVEGAGFGRRGSSRRRFRALPASPFPS